MRRRGMVAPRFLWSVVTWLCVLLAGGFWATPATAYKPEGEMRWALYVTISPAWLDPAEVAVSGLNSFWFCYALHDALVKPMPGNPMAPSLAESWTVSDDQRVDELKLRDGLKFQYGDRCSAEDVEVPLWGSQPPSSHAQVGERTAVEPYRVRCHRSQPWPGFRAYYGTMATGPGWIAPKSYRGQVARDGSKTHPSGLRRYKSGSHTPGI